MELCFERSADLLDLGLFDVAEKLECQMNIRDVNPANTRNSRFKLIDRRGNFVDDLRVDVHGDESANHKSNP